MRKARKYTFGFVIGVFICGLGARTLWDSTSSPANVTLPVSEIPRSPAGVSLVPTPPESTAHLCQNIYPLVCQKNATPFKTNDPTGTVRSDIEGEKLALSLYTDIIHAHRDWSIDQIDEEMAIQTFTPARRGRIESAFHWVKNNIEQFINQQPGSVFTPHEKQMSSKMISRMSLSKRSM